MPARRVAFVGLAAVGLMAAVPPAAQAARQDTATYVVHGSEPVVAAVAFWAARSTIDVICGPSGDTVSAGGACFDVLPGERSMTVQLEDVSGRGVSAVVRFTGKGLDRTTDGGRGTRFCRRATVPVPDGATRAEVVVDSIVYACGVTAARTATTGTITAAFA